MFAFANKSAGLAHLIRMFQLRCQPLAAIAAIWLAVTSATAAEPQPSDPNADAIREAGMAYLQAIESGDLEEAASFWTEDGDLVDPLGKAVKARDLFERMASGPRQTRPKMSIKSQDLRFIRPDVALEDGSYEVAPIGDGRPSMRRFTAVWVKQGGNWLLDSVREAPLPAGRGNRLASLAWLVGDWVEESGDTRTTISCKFNATKTYLLRTIQVEQAGRVVFSGEQSIGWDAASEQFRSWMFDLDGGRTEGDWHQEDNAWVVDATGVSADGKQSSSTRVYESLGPNEFTVESTNGLADGDAVPDFKKTFTRIAPSQPELPAADRGQDAGSN